VNDAGRSRAGVHCGVLACMLVGFAALHTDPYFYDRHVTVSVENGAVVLRGFVFSDWGLRDAIRIAKRAAGDTPVVDNLWIKLGGGR